MRWSGRQTQGTAWRELRDRLLDRERWRHAFTYNVPLKLLSVLLAFSLWFFVNFGERDTEESLKVPLELRNIPAHLMITSPRVDFVDVRVSGPRTLLGRIDRNRLSVPLDLSGVRPGPAVFRVDPEQLVLPRGVKVVRINPAQLTLELERLGHKAVAVRVHIQRRPPPDLTVADTKVSPETVEAIGPVSDLDDVHVATTEGLDLSQAQAGTVERELPLAPAGEYVSFSANRVAVQVRLTETATTREFRRVTVEVRNAGRRLRVVPDRVRLVVRGPKTVLERLELKRGSVYVDAQGDDAGEREVKPAVTLPAGVELVTVEPDHVRLVPSRGKRGS